MLHTMKPVVLVFLLCSILLTSTTLSQATTAYPSTTNVECSLSGGHSNILIPPRREVYGNGRVIDITHRYTPDMPSYHSVDGVGQFLWLLDGMKNGSVVNMSVMKLLAHSGTHVDAPSHVFDHYYDAKFDIDTLDLDVLNGNHILVNTFYYTCTFCFSAWL